MQQHFRISGKSFQRSSWGLLALGLGLIVILWTNLLWTYRDIEEKTVQDQEIYLTNLAEALRLQTDSVLRGVDNLAIRLRREYQTRGKQAFTADTQGFINRAMEGFAVQAVIVDRQGMLVWSSEPAVYPMDLTDREYFRHHADAPEADNLFMGAPILNRISQRWIIPLSRPLLGYGGRQSFNGVLMISLDPSHFATLLRRVELGKNGVISLIASEDGSYLVRSTLDQHWVGKKVANNLPIRDAQGPEKGVLRQISRETGMEHLYAYRRFPEYGITLLVETNLQEALTPIRSRAQASYALALLISIAIATLVLYLSQLLRRHGETEAELESEHRILREAERIGQVGSWQWDLGSNILVGSEQVHRMFCFEESWGAIPPARFQERIHMDDRQRVLEAMREARRTGEPLRDLEYRIVCPDGSTRVVLACGEHLHDGDKRQMIGTLLDITALRASQKKLLEAKIVFDHAQEAVVVSDAQGIIQAVNPAFERITGYAGKEALGRKTSLLASGRHSREFYQHMWQQLADQGHWEGEIWNRRKNGSLYVEWLTIRAVLDNGGSVQQYVALFSDITDRKQREEAVWHRAYHDALTGLPNRSLFQDRLEHAIASAQRDKSKMGLMFIDLDRFKEINDTLGHAAGDELLKQVAERLRGSVRASDTVARLAGDEFMVLVEGIPEPLPLATLSEKLLAQLNQPFQLDGHLEAISASIGIALYPAHGLTAQALIQAADQAMYAAKHKGRNAYVFAPNPGAASPPPGEV